MKFMCLVLAFVALLVLAHAFKLSPKSILEAPEVGSNVSDSHPEEASALVWVDKSKGEFAVDPKFEGIFQGLWFAILDLWFAILEL